MYLGLTHILFICIISLHTLSAQDNQKLLMILVDGFRWDYLDQPSLNLPGFQRIVDSGVKANYLTSVFPVSSYPNYYSATTGLYSESHGIISNYMYDATKKEKFIIGRNIEYNHTHWWNKAEPIWVSAVKQNKRSHMYFWPGCDITIQNVNPTHCQPHKGVPSMEDFATASNDILNKFKSDESDMGGIYVEIFDHNGHQYGPKSSQLKKGLKDFDDELQKMLDNIQSMGLKHTLNVMIFADHGMADMTSIVIINTTEVIQHDDYDVIMGAEQVASLWPKSGKEKEVYNKLKKFHPKMNVYLKDDLPESLHYKNDRLIAPITMIVDYPGYMLTPEHTQFYVYKPENTPMMGDHGYAINDPDMRGIFLAFGPSFKANYRTPGMSITDLYQIMTRIISIKPLSNNGTWSTVQNMLTNDLPVPVGGASIVSGYTISMLLVGISVFFV